MTKYCNKYCNAGEKVLLRWRKKAADHRNMRHSLRNSPPDCFCQMLRIWSLVSQVQILQINKKRKQAILKNGLLPFGRGDKNIGVKFGLAAGFLPFCTATVLQRRYCCKNCSIDCLIICACAIPSAAHFSRKAEAISLGALIFSYLYLCSTFLWSIRGKLLHIGVCRLCVLILIIGEHIAVGV